MHGESWVIHSLHRTFCPEQRTKKMLSFLKTWRTVYNVTLTLFWRIVAAYHTHSCHAWCWNMVRCRYNTVTFLSYHHSRHPMPRTTIWIFCEVKLSFMFSFRPLQYSTKCHVILDRVIRALGCIGYLKCLNLWISPQRIELDYFADYFVVKTILNNIKILICV